MKRSTEECMERRRKNKTETENEQVTERKRANERRRAKTEAREKKKRDSGAEVGAKVGACRGMFLPWSDSRLS